MSANFSEHRPLNLGHATRLDEAAETLETILLFALVRFSLYGMSAETTFVKLRRNPDRPLNQDPVRLRERRIQAGLSLAAVAERLGRSKGTISEIESPRRTRSASPELLAELAKVYRCKIADLMPRKEAA